MTAILHGSCHCGVVQFDVKPIDGLGSARRCTCSFCSMRGAIVISVELADFQIRTGVDKLSSYRFNTGTAEHFFCSVCGIYTHHQRRSKPTEYGVNVACLEGTSPFDFAEVKVMDGQNHPSDTGQSKVAGILTYRRSG